MHVIVGSLPSPPPSVGNGFPTGIRLSSGAPQRGALLSRRRRLVRPCDPSWGREGDPRQFDSHTGDLPTRDVRHGPLKEGWEEGIPQFILYRLKGHPYVQGDALHEGPLLL